jgi:hypothetical protein
VLARLALETIGVLVWNRHGERVQQFRDSREHRRGVREFRKDDEPDRKERRAAGDGGIDHGEHAVRIRSHLIAMDGIGQVRLTGRRRVSDCLAHRITPASIDGSGRFTTRVL